MNTTHASTGAHVRVSIGTTPEISAWERNSSGTSIALLAGMKTRSILWTSLFSLSLLTAGACKKRDADRASDDMKQAQDDINKEGKALGKTVEKADESVAKDQAKLDSAKADWEKAAADYGTAVHARLEKLDAKLNVLAAKADAKSREAEQKIKERRDVLASKLDGLATQGTEHWDAFKKDVDSSFDSLEHDLNAAIK